MNDRYGLLFNLLLPFWIILFLAIDTAAGTSEEAIALHTDAPVVVDGVLSEPEWSKAIRSPAFVDMVTGDVAWYETRAALLWDDKALYVAYWVSEPNVQARLTQRDACIYTENDVELFIDGVDAYYELEINASGIIYEVFWIWDDAADRPFFQRPEFNTTQHPTMKLNGIGSHVHSRGMRTGFLDWDLPSLRWATRVQGTINDSRDTDVGWTVELAIPWSSLTLLAHGRSLPPLEGDRWRMDFSRFEHTDAEGNPLVPPAGWSWTPHGVFDSHMPEKFTQVRFLGPTIDE
ncbi:MAG: carbohydrate-binding family 9-like protein [Desulfovibrio sp.]|nr:carbohydrate-binding family 9-like protein [Desulfovibrio sp.]